MRYTQALGQLDHGSPFEHLIVADADTGALYQDRQTTGDVLDEIQGRKRTRAGLIALAGAGALYLLFAARGKRRPKRRRRR